MTKSGERSGNGAKGDTQGKGEDGLLENITEPFMGGNGHFRQKPKTDEAIGRI
jgi:hypothetical protein